MMNKTQIIHGSLVFMTCALAACMPTMDSGAPQTPVNNGGGMNGDGTGSDVSDPGAVNDPGKTPATSDTPATGNAGLCGTNVVGKSYIGFDKNPLEAGRVAAKAGDNTLRVKPFSTLSAEYTKALGTAPATLQGAASSFPTTPARWYTEPTGSAVILYSLFQVNFAGCLTYAQGNAALAAAPTAATAPTQCTAMANKFWNQSPSQAQVDACSKEAVTDTAAETNPTRRWAYACASMLSSAGFLSY